MMDLETYAALLDAVNHPIVFTDNDHVIRHLNRAAQKRYYEQRGFSDLVGKSLFDCHNADSVGQIRVLHERLRAGEDEIFMKVNQAGERITVVAVRDGRGTLLGYYERFEKTPSAGGSEPTGQEY